MSDAQKIDWSEQEFSEVRPDIFGATVLNAVLPRLEGHTVGLFMSVRERPEVDDTVPELDLMRLVERQVPTGMLFPLLDSMPPAPGRALTPRQWAGGRGGRHRRRPVGGAAYGMPRNSSTVPAVLPRTAPS